MNYLDQVAAEVAAETAAQQCVRGQVGYSVPLMARPNRRVWLAKRRRHLTATDVPAILGLSPYKTPVDVWLDKTGRTPHADVSYEMARGNALEPLLRAEWAATRKAATVTVPPLSGHPTDPLAAASLDGAGLVDGQPRLLEIKTASWRMREDWWDDDKQIPDHYLAQVAWQSYVTGLDADVIVDVAGDVRIIGPVPRSPEWEAYAVPLLHAWWVRHVIEGAEPAPDPVRDYDLLNLLWQPVPGQSVDADDAMARAVDIYHAAAAKQKALKAVQASARGRIRTYMKTASRLTDPWSGKRLASIDTRGTLRVAKPTGEGDRT